MDIDSFLRAPLFSIKPTTFLYMGKTQQILLAIISALLGVDLAVMILNQFSVIGSYITLLINTLIYVGGLILSLVGWIQPVKSFMCNENDKSYSAHNGDEGEPDSEY